MSLAVIALTAVLIAYQKDAFEYPRVDQFS
jgi:hypothetical protein